MEPMEALTEKHRSREMPDICYGCAHAVMDVEEGWLCKGFDAKITLSSGQSMRWPGQACVSAFYNDCHGEGFKKSFYPGIMRKHPFISILISSIIFATLAISIVQYFK